MGRWKKTAERERHWLEQRFGSRRAPDRVFNNRRTKFGDSRRDFVGVRGGSDMNGEIVNLHAHEWNLVDVDTAQEMAEDFGGLASQPRSITKKVPSDAGAMLGEASAGVTLSLTCPSAAPSARRRARLQEAADPPGRPLGVAEAA